VPAQALCGQLEPREQVDRRPGRREHARIHHDQARLDGRHRRYDCTERENSSVDQR